MFAVTFLGTSASVPSAERNHPGLLVEAGSHRIPVDCGEGAQRRLLRSCGIGVWWTDYLQPMDETGGGGDLGTCASSDKQKKQLRFNSALSCLLSDSALKVFSRRNLPS
jgi:hypothetical protein